MTVEPIEVECPDCLAGAGVACRISNEGIGAEFHAERVRIAGLRSLDQGVCALCGSFLVRGGDPVDAWHPDPNDAERCPPLPDPRTEWAAYARLINSGVQPGHPGIENFMAAGEHHPECNEGCGDGTHLLLSGDSAGTPATQLTIVRDD